MQVNILMINNIYSHRLHLFDFSPLCLNICILRSDAKLETYSHWLHFLSFSSMFLFLCIVKLPAEVEEYLHWLHLWGLSSLSLHVVFQVIWTSRSIFALSPATAYGRLTILVAHFFMLHAFKGMIKVKVISYNSDSFGKDFV